MNNDNENGGGRDPYFDWDHGVCTKLLRNLGAVGALGVGVECRMWKTTFFGVRILIFSRNWRCVPLISEPRLCHWYDSFSSADKLIRWTKLCCDNYVSGVVRRPTGSMLTVDSIVVQNFNHNGIDWNRGRLFNGESKSIISCALLYSRFAL